MCTNLKISSFKYVQRSFICQIAKKMFTLMKISVEVQIGIVSSLLNIQISCKFIKFGISNTTRIKPENDGLMTSIYV